MPGIWAAVKATTRVVGSPRKTVLKLWKSRPAAPMIITRRSSTRHSSRSFSKTSSPDSVGRGSHDPFSPKRLPDMAKGPFLHGKGPSRQQPCKPDSVNGSHPSGTRVATHLHAANPEASGEQPSNAPLFLSLIHISEPTRLGMIS